MAAVEIEIEGFPQLIAAISILADTTMKDAVEVLQVVGRAIAIEAQWNAPVRTGRLKDSIVSTPNETGAVVTAGSGVVDYAAYVEFGTQKMVGRAYMSRAVEDAISELMAMYEEKLP